MVNASQPEAIERTRQALAAQGFGVLSEIDVAATLQAKLGVQVPPQVILGACNPQLANKALEIEPDIGLLLPCNVVVREDGGRTVVAALDPQIMVQVPGRPELAEVAAEAGRRLDEALQQLSGSAAGGEQLSGSAG